MSVNFRSLPDSMIVACVSYLNPKDLACYVGVDNKARKEVNGRDPLSYKINFNDLPKVSENLIVIAAAWEGFKIGFTNPEMKTTDAIKIFNAIRKKELSAKGERRRALHKINVMGNNLHFIALDGRSKGSLAEAGFRLGSRYTFQ